MTSSLLDGLDETQLEAVTATSEPLAILAGAGSGKTRVLTRRIAWRADQLDLEPSGVLAVTFTRKAASELRQRLNQLHIAPGIKTGTFHSLAYAQLHQRWAERGIRPPELLDRKVGFVASLIPRGDKTLPLDVTTELEWVSARALTSATYPHAAQAAKRTPPLPIAEMVDVIDRYRDEKRRRRLVDFDDLLWLCIRDLGDEEYASRIRQQHRHFFVDEFQDINPLQFNLLNSWLGGRKDLCVVGDPNQAIYGWNGADASYIRWFEDKFNGGTTIQLGHNYRSTPQVVAAGHSILPSNVRDGKPPVAHLPDGDKPHVNSYQTDRLEAAATARLTQEAFDRGTPWSEQAVLVRTNAQTAIVAEQFRANQIPTQVRGGSRLINQPEVKQLLTLIRRCGHELADAVEPVRDEIEANAPKSSGATTAELDRHSNRQALQRLLTDHLSADPDSSTGSFLDWVTSTATQEETTSSDAVEIMTFHAAKGLEWTCVYILGVERGLVPIGYAETPAELAEERRLLHVGITRAKESVYLSWAEERQFGDKTVRRNRSSYLDILDPPPENTTVKSKSAPSRLSAASAKADLPVDDPDYKALVEWRRTTAEEDAVPAYIVVNNRTIAALVRMMPSTMGELLDVPGIGPAKADRYGKEILRILND